MSADDPAASAFGGFYVVWRGADPLGVQITKGTSMSDALTAVALIGADSDSLLSLSTPASLAKSRTLIKALHDAPSAPTRSTLSYGPGRA